MGAGRMTKQMKKQRAEETTDGEISGGENKILIQSQAPSRLLDGVNGLF